MERLLNKIFKYIHGIMNGILGIQPRKWGKIMQPAGGGIMAKRASVETDLASDTTATR